MKHKKYKQSKPTLKLPKDCPKMYQGVGDETCWNCKLNRESRCPYNKFTEPIFKPQEVTVNKSKFIKFVCVIKKGFIIMSKVLICEVCRKYKNVKSEEEFNKAVNKHLENWHLKLKLESKTESKTKLQQDLFPAN